jgi:hypothetical protein
MGATGKSFSSRAKEALTLTSNGADEMNVVWPEGEQPWIGLIRQRRAALLIKVHGVLRVHRFISARAFRARAAERRTSSQR